MKGCMIMVLLFTCLTAFSQIEYSVSQYSFREETGIGYITDYEKVLARNKVKKVTEIVGKDSTGYAAYEYEYDRKGRIIKYNTLSQPYTDVITYNKAGLISAENRVTKTGNDTLFKVHYEYNEQGHATRITFWAEKNGLLTWLYTNRYDSAGRLAVQSVALNGELHQISTYEYNDSGRLARIKMQRDSSSRAITNHTFMYDSAGRLIFDCCAIYMGGNGLCQQYTYDGKGQLEKISHRYAEPTITHTYLPNGLKKQQLHEGAETITFRYEFYK